MKHIAALIAALALCLPASAFATDATVTGGTADATWTHGSVADVSLTMTDCGSDGQLTCSWHAVAGKVPAAEGCPDDWFFPPSPTQFSAFWASTGRSANTTVHSGAKSFSLNGAAGQRVCVYLDRTFTGTGFQTSFLITSELLTVAQEPPPAGSGEDECQAARDQLTAAKKKLKRLKRRDAKRSKIRKAKRKVQRARGAVDASC